MNTRDDGGPAFPIGKPFVHEKGFDPAPFPGLSYLDYAAIKAMQVLIPEADYGDDPRSTAVAAYVYADAMLAEKRRREGETT